MHLLPLRPTSAQVTDVMLHLQRNWQLVDGGGLSLVPWVAEQADHGDIDLICDAEPATVVRFAPLVGVDPRAIVRNDRVLSMPVPLPWESDRPSPGVAQGDMAARRRPRGSVTAVLRRRRGLRHAAGAGRRLAPPGVRQGRRALPRRPVRP